MFIIFVECVGGSVCNMFALSIYIQVYEVNSCALSLQVWGLVPENGPVQVEGEGSVVVLASSVFSLALF